MREIELKRYLTEDYCGPINGKPLTKRPTQDAASRGSRIERVLGIDLDRCLDGSPDAIEALLEFLDLSKHRFEIDGDLNSGMSSIKNAAKRYNDFRAWENRRNDSDK